MRKVAIRKSGLQTILSILILIPIIGKANGPLKAPIYVSQTATFQTEDTTAPTAPTNLYAYSTTGTATYVSWTASTDDVGVTTYDIYKDNTFLATVNGTTTTYRVSGLTEVTKYLFTVKAKDAAGNVSASSNEISVTTPDATKPTAPTNLSYSGVTPTGMTLSWNASTDNVGVIGYDIYNVNVLKGTSDTTTFTVSGLSPNTTYSFNVKARDAAGNVSNASSSLSAKSYDSMPPTAPTALTAPGATTTTVSLSWTAATDNYGVVGYDIFKGGNVFVGTTTATSFTVTGLTANNTYLFTVKARDAVGNLSDPSTGLIAKTADTTPPTAPTNLVILETTATTANLSWTAATDNEGVTSYEIYKNGTFYTTANTTTYVVGGLSPTTTYLFSVKAKDAAGNVSSESNSVMVTTSAVIPTYCVSAGYSDMLVFYMTRVRIGSIDKYSGQASNCYGDYTNIETELKKGEVYSITINPYLVTNTTEQLGKRYAVWIDYNGDKDFYDSGERVWNHIVTDQSPVTGTFTVPNSVVAGRTRMRVTIIQDGVGIPSPCGDYTGTVTDGETEDYTVNIVDNFGDPQGPTAPTNLAATGTTWTTTSLSWTAPTGTTGNVTYEIYKENVLIGTSETTNYSVTGLNQNTPYLFTVKAKNSNGNVSVSSVPVLVTTVKDQIPSKPTNLIASGTTATKTNLSWTASVNNSGGIIYQVYASTVIQSNVFVAQSSTPNCTVTDLMTNQNYTFAVKAVDSDGNTSAMSNSIPVTTLSESTDKIPPTAPTNLTVTNVTATSAVLSWTAGTDDESGPSYTIYNGSTKLAVAGKATTTYTLTGLTEGTNYSLSVKAVDVGGNTAVSNIVSVTTIVLPKYCSSYTTGGTYDEIYDFELASISRYGTYGPYVSNYKDLTYKSTNLTPGQENLFSIEFYKSSGNADPNGVALWIDFNNDKDFDDPGELVWSKLVNAPSFTPTTGSFTIPVTATIGKTRMRLSIKKNGIPTACEIFPYGRIEDYSVNIQKPIVEFEAPTTPVNVAASGITASTTDLSWTAATDNIAVTTYDIYKGNTLVGSTATTTFKVTGLQSSTSYSITVKARDYAGNISVASDAVLVTTLSDTTAPTAPTNLVVSGTTTTSTNLSWTAATDDIGVTAYDVYKDNILLGTVAATTYAVTGLAPGTIYSFTIKAKDAAGNISVASNALSMNTVDTVPPTAPTNLAASDTTTTTTNLSWTASTDKVGVSGYSIYKNGNYIVTVTGTTYTVTGLTQGTAYSFTVKARDAAANFSGDSNVVSVTTLIQDATAPTAPTSLTASSVTSTTVNLSWTASTDNVGVTAYDVFKGSILMASVTAPSYLVTGLNPGTTYSFTVKAKDAAGNISSASNTVSVTTPMQDTTAPTAPSNLIASDVTETTTTLSWTSSNDNVGVTAYEVYEDSYHWATVTATTYILTGLKPGTTYTFLVKAKDASSNISKPSNTVSVTTLFSDTIVPTVPTNLTATGTTATTTDLSWDFSTDNVGVIAYDVYQGGDKIGTTAETTYAITGLNPGTIYSFTVKAKDAAGNSSADSNTVSVTTIIQDITAPTAPTNLNASDITATTITLSWTASTDNVNGSSGKNKGNLGAVKYEVYIDNILYTTVTGTTCTITDMNPGTTYSITIKAKDAAGNVSEVSDSFTVTTLTTDTLETIHFKMNDIVKLYPSPTSDFVTIEISSVDNLQLRVFDVTGRFLFSKVLKEKYNTLDISNLPIGVYMFKISNESGAVLKKVIKN